MKKFTIVLIVLMGAAMFAPQNIEAGVGFKAGYSSSQFALSSSGEIPFDWGPLSSFTGGLYFSLGLGFFSVQPEILYTRMGGRYEVDADSLEFRFDYVQVPVLLKLNIIPAGPIRPFIYGGAYGGYLVKATGVMVTGGETISEDIRDTFQEFDYGVLGGVGLTFKLVGIALTVEGRYNYGLQNLYIEPAEGEFMRNTSMVGLVGIHF
jgi:hypothetical protein